MDEPASFGPYRVVRALARGGMGAVLEVEDVRSGARRALKTLLGPDPLAHERLRREAETLARLDHPHVVRVHAADLEASPPWVVLDLLPGGALEHRLRAGPLPLPDALALCEQVALAVAHAHARGVLHRDLKPLNVLFDDRGAPRLVDFGLAGAAGAGPELGPRLTLTGEVMGTPAYLAPEQALGLGEVDARADVFGLGALLFACLAARPPIEGATAFDALRNAAEGRVTSLADARPDLPGPVRDLVARALARDPAARPPTAAAFAAAVAALRRDVVARALAPEAAGPVGAALGRLAPAALVVAAVGAVAAAFALGRPARRAGHPGPSAPATATATDAPRGRPLRLDLEAPAEGALAAGRVELRGRVRGGVGARTVEAGGAQVVVAAAPAAARAGSPASGSPGEAFALACAPPAPGARLEVVVRDEAGAVARVAVAVHLAPPWVVARAPEDRPAWPPPPGLRFDADAGEVVHERSGAPMVWIPPGPDPDGQPVRGFWLGRYEVRWRDLWRWDGAREHVERYVQLSMDDGDPTVDADRPAHSLTAAQVEAYCAAVGARLPRAAEWRRAALGAGGRRFPWGDDPPAPRAEQGQPDPRANCGPRPEHTRRPGPTGRSRPCTWPAGSGDPAGASPFGCLDMVGNVREELARVGLGDGPPGTPRPTTGGSWREAPPPPGLPLDWSSETNDHGIGFRLAFP